MRAKSVEGFIMSRMSYPKPWNWSDEASPRRLSEWGIAPEAIGFYEIGYMVATEFEPMYCGRAAGVTLRVRLGQHFSRSHNEEIRNHRDLLWYRFKVLKTFELACYIEAIHIAALDYPGNKRNEWTQHWALES
jgi:hypothetical protein